MAKYSREELQRAHDNYLAVAQEAGRSGNWRPWADLFTEDADYIEHHYGTLHGREAIYEWIAKTMSEWPNSEMKEFPHDWCVCDEERGLVDLPDREPFHRSGRRQGVRGLQPHRSRSMPVT